MPILTIEASLFQHFSSSTRNDSRTRLSRRRGRGRRRHRLLDSETFPILVDLFAGIPFSATISFPVIIRHFVRACLKTSEVVQNLCSEFVPHLEDWRTTSNNILPYFDTWLHFILWYIAVFWSKTSNPCERRPPKRSKADNSKKRNHRRNSRERSLRKWSTYFLLS